MIKIAARFGLTVLWAIMCVGVVGNLINSRITTNPVWERVLFTFVACANITQFTFFVIKRIRNTEPSAVMAASLSRLNRECDFAARTGVSGEWIAAYQAELGARHG